MSVGLISKSFECKRVRTSDHTTESFTHQEAQPKTMEAITKYLKLGKFGHFDVVRDTQASTC